MVGRTDYKSAIGVLFGVRLKLGWRDELLRAFIFVGIPLFLVGSNVIMAHQDERFIPPRQKLDQLSVVKDYAALPRLEYR